MSRAPLRVLQITACDFPPEIRVLKAARTLRDAGHVSAVMCPPMTGRPAREEWNGIAIFRPDHLRRAATMADKVLYQSTFRSPAWRQATREVVREFRPDALHVHDIWLARSTMVERGSARVVMDLHENMPAAVDEYLKAYRGAQWAFNRVFKGRSRVLRYEGETLRASDLTLVVVEEAAARVRAEHPDLARDRVVNVENLESLEFVATLQAAAPAAGIAPAGDARPSILYIGGFGPHRGIDTVITAMKQLKDWGVAARLDLVGARGGDYVQMLRALTTRLDIWSHVNMVNWVPAESVLSIIRRADICTVPHHSNPHTDNTIPHKLYQYMIAGRPVLVSTSAPLARTVRAANAGAVFAAGDAADCARRIREMLADSDALRRLGENGRRYVVEEGHNWEQESAPRLLAAYERFQRSAPPAREAALR